MDNETKEAKQIIDPESTKKGFFAKNVVGVIVFSVWFFAALIQTTFLPSLVFDTVVGLIIASIVQLLFNVIKKSLGKKIDPIDNKTDNLKMEINHNQKSNDFRTEHMIDKIKSVDTTTQAQQKINSTNQKYQLDRKIKCNSCGEMVNYKSNFCHKCGNKIEKEKICKNCNKKYPIDSNFCPYCGIKAVASHQTCSNCGENYELGSKYCPSCGVSSKEV